jgi:hypothetical protein
MLENKPVEPQPQLDATPKPSTTWRDKFLPRTPQEIAIAVCALGIFVAFFTPWVLSGADSYSGYTLYRANKWFKILWLVPLMALATLATLKNHALSS